MVDTTLSKRNAPRLDYFQNKIYKAVQEIYASYSSPVGVRSISSFLRIREEGRIDRALNALGEKGLLKSVAHGVWVPAESKDPLNTTIHKNIIRQHIDLLQHALGTLPPKDLPGYVSRWCEDLEDQLF